MALRGGQGVGDSAGGDMAASVHGGQITKGLVGHFSKVFGFNPTGNRVCEGC